MEKHRPYNRIQAVYEHEHAADPEIYYLSEIDGIWKVSRRDFVKTLVNLPLIMMGLGAIGGCATSEAKIELRDAHNKLVETKTLPCGSPIPPGAICTCNCIPVYQSSPTYHRTCSCVPVCTCNKICTCVPIV